MSTVHTEGRFDPHRRPLSFPVSYVLCLVPLMTTLWTMRRRRLVVEILTCWIGQLGEQRVDDGCRGGITVIADVQENWWLELRVGRAEVSDTTMLPTLRSLLRAIGSKHLCSLSFCLELDC